MPLTTGTTIGPYEILAPIGAGGMGEVYRALDRKLKRDVALKVLPEGFTDNFERLTRFQREAEVLASLNHPNIAHIYGVEERALAMELVDGATLAGPLPIEIALNYAKQIAEALEYAHDRGVIHRDLKPANVKITLDGVVKLLDFGLAKATEDPAASINPSNSPTLTLGATSVGVILGTAAYMAPEQAGGKVADRRSDIWSFGAVLYEMLSGKQAFAGESISDTLATVMKVEPDWSALPQDVPASIHKLVRRCLTKDRKQRLQAIGEARIVLENPGRDEPTVSAPAMVSRQSRFAWVISAVLAIALATVAFVHFREQPPVEQSQRYAITLPEGSTVHSFAISPDARYIAIAAITNGKQQLWLRPVDALQAQLMPTTEDATFPFWSPDSRYIGFFAQGKLKKIAAGGGPSQTLCDASSPRSGSWNREDTIIFSQSGNTPHGIQRVPAGGGVPTDVFKTGQYRYPMFLPDGRHFLYTDIRPSETSGIYIASLDGTENRRILTDRSAAVFAPASHEVRSGHILFARENNLMAIPFDAGTGQVTGDAFPVAEGVSLASINAGYTPVSVSENGVLLYWTGDAAGGANQMGWYDRTGKSLGSVGMPGQVFNPVISPDEKLIAFARTGRSSSDIWVRDLFRETDRRFTTTGGRNQFPAWSPNADRIAYLLQGETKFGLYMKATNGFQEEQFSPDAGRIDQWSRDGRFLVVTRSDQKTNLDVWAFPIEEGANRKPIPFVQSEFDEFQGQLSPDSRWMAYVSDKSRQRDVYVSPFPQGNAELKISTEGGDSPRWRADGHELFYLSLDGKMMSVTVRTTPGAKPSIEPEVPVPLFESHVSSAAAPNSFQYDVTADGKRFMIVTQGNAASPSLTVVLNWTAGMKK
jgi:serine/threonine protein kinase